MANKIQTRRGLKSKLPSSASAGEPLFITDSHELFMGTGSSVVNMTGSRWYSGTAMSGTSTTAEAYYYSTCPEVKVGDYYLNTNYGYVYECVTAGSGATARWTYKGSIRGATGGTGGTGPQGTRGTRWNIGTACTGTSTSNTQFSTGISDSIVGDMYLNTSTGYIYRCTVEGASTVARWVYVGSIKGVTGSQGTRGSIINTGTAMSHTSGAGSYSGASSALVGDLYINTTYGYLYRCTTAGSGTTAKWTYQCTIKGPQGKDAADYVVSGSDELAAAIEALKSTGGRILLERGTYSSTDYSASTLSNSPTIIIEGVNSNGVILDSFGFTTGTGTIEFRDLSLQLGGGRFLHKPNATLIFDRCAITVTGSTPTSYSVDESVRFIYAASVKLLNSTITITGAYPDNMNMVDGFDAPDCYSGIYANTVWIDNCFVILKPTSTSTDSRIDLNLIYHSNNAWITNCRIAVTQSGWCNLVKTCAQSLNMNNNFIYFNSDKHSIGHSADTDTSARGTFTGNVVEYYKTYMKFGAISGNTFIHKSAGTSSANQMILQCNTCLTGNHFMGEAVYIDGKSKKHIIDRNITDGGITVGSAASGSVTTNNVTY